jgi:hypothetical protein
MFSLKAPFIKIAISEDITSKGFICERSYFWSPICIIITKKQVIYRPELSV